MLNRPTPVSAKACRRINDNSERQSNAMRYAGPQVKYIAAPRSSGGLCRLRRGRLSGEPRECDQLNELANLAQTAVGRVVTSADTEVELSSRLVATVRPRIGELSDPPLAVSRLERHCDAKRGLISELLEPDVPRVAIDDTHATRASLLLEAEVGQHSRELPGDVLRSGLFNGLVEHRVKCSAWFGLPLLRGRHAAVAFPLVSEHVMHPARVVLHELGPRLR